jgi:hypothetical protein
VERHSDEPSYESPGRDVVRLSWEVNLEHPSEESLEAIKSRMIEKLTRAVVEEFGESEEGQAARRRPQHNRHSRTIDW